MCIDVGFALVAGGYFRSDINCARACKVTPLTYLLVVFSIKNVYLSGYARFIVKVYGEVG